MSDPATVSRRVLLAAGALAVAGIASAQSTGDGAQLAAIMERYAAALRANDVAALVGLYAADGVFMRDELPAVQGTEALRAAYGEIFTTLKVDLDFAIQQTEIAGDMAWLRMMSKGLIKTLSTNAEAEASFNGLVVFRRIDGDWKIRAYLYASSKPGAGAPQ